MGATVKKPLRVLAWTIPISFAALLAYLRFSPDPGEAVVEKCLRLEPGMTRDEVVAVMGPPGSEITHPGPEGMPPRQTTLRFGVPWYYDTIPEVAIDEGTGKVEMISCTESDVKSVPGYFQRGRSEAPR